MTDEEIKARNREKTQRYRDRHRNDPEYKARAYEAKKRQWAKNPDHRRKAQAIRQQRHREKFKDTPEYRAKSAEWARKWREKNPDREAAAKAEWAAKNRAKCKEYRKRFSERNPDYDRIKAAENPELIRFYAANRRFRIRQAMPPWADLDEIESVYLAAHLAGEQTGIMHHVDHIVPLKHNLVCGLHVPANLRVITATENLLKRNKFEVV